MKNKGNVLNSLLIMLAGLNSRSCTGSAETWRSGCRFTSSMFKKVMQQIGLAVFLFPIVK